MCTYLSLYIYIYIYTYNTYMYTYMYVYIYIYIYVYIYILYTYQRPPPTPSSYDFFSSTFLTSATGHNSSQVVLSFVFSFVDMVKVSCEESTN